MTINFGRFVAAYACRAAPEQAIVRIHMERAKTRRERLIWRLAGLLAGTLVIVAGVGALAAGADGTADPAWAAPAATALKRISSISIGRHEPAFLSNLDCDLTDYRTPPSNVMQTGCFTRTAFGLVDSDSDTAIFSGTDEGLPLVPFTAHQVLVPWPQALDMLTLDSASTGGSYVGIYDNPLSVMSDKRDSLLRLTAKQLTAPPRDSLDDPDGKQLVINPQSLAFSSNGAWLAAETFGGAFVRINLATLGVTAFAPSFGMTGSPALLKSQVAVSDNGRFIAIANDAASQLRVYDLANCVNGSRWQDRRCSEHDYYSFAREQIPGLQAVRHVRFANDSLLSFEARAADSTKSGVYLLAPRDGIKSLTDYLALGDSYTSGEGAFDYLTGTDTAGNTCHLSVNSYPLLLTRALFSSAGGHSVACSGAVINDIGSTSPDYRGQVKDGLSLQQLQQEQAAMLDSIMTNYGPGYVAQQEFAKKYQPAMMTVSIGGNDIGFGDILEKCVAPHISLRGGNDCYNTYEGRLEATRLIDRTIPRWTALYKQLLAEAPGTRLYAVGYPQIVSDSGGCALNVHLSQSEREFALELTDYLNDDIRQAAAKAGIAYVDISLALAGHRLCEAESYDVAVNGLTAGKDAGVLGIGILGKESYHPNALGHALIEQAILEQTHNLTGVDSAAGEIAANILNAPKTGRQVNVVIPNKLTGKVLKAGASVSVNAAGPPNGLKARASYTIRLGGPAGRAIGTVISDASGNLTSVITLPADMEKGGQTIDITGENQAGEPVDLTQPVYVPTDVNDADGDGVADAADSCPAAINSGQDADRDGIDDACDDPIHLAVGQGQTGTDATGGAARLDSTARVVTVLPRQAGHQKPTGHSIDNTNLSLSAKAEQAPPARLPAVNRPPANLLAAIWLLAALLFGYYRLRRTNTTR